MTNLTITVPDDLEAAIDDHPEINWSEVARRAMWRYVARVERARAIASESELDRAEATALSEAIAADVAKHYRGD